MDEPQVNTPASGSQGSAKALSDLASALPKVSGPAGGSPGERQLPPISEQPRPVPNPGGRPVTGAAVPPGLPSILAGPSQQPDVPVGTPLQQGPPTPQTPQQDRLLWLDQLSSDPVVSQATRDWAQALIKTLLSGGRS